MRVLLDENVPKRLKRTFASDIEVMTVVERGWSGKKNGELLRLAEKDFDALVTTDRSISYQQNVPGFDLAILILEGMSNDYGDLEPLMPEVNDVLREMPPGTSRRVPEN
ncbi:MAG: DUF5615 family PIN-like protein [Actinomycetota bacterium]|nr:DUF5615 family PIN-like protein [Rubrobacter sp.]MDQ3506622.1 DUF5615 family PIN-like protein [Actinomycetota bacterium]